MISIGLQEVALACIAWFLTTGGLDGHIGENELNITVFITLARALVKKYAK